MLRKIRRANETDINDILLSRNYNFNRKFMINKNTKLRTLYGGSLIKTFVRN